MKNHVNTLNSTTNIIDQLQHTRPQVRLGILGLIDICSYFLLQHSSMNHM